MDVLTMNLSRNHKYEVGHYYKRTYWDGDWVIFTVNGSSPSEDDEQFRLYTSTILSKNGHTRYKTMINYFPDATTVELSYEDVVGEML